MTTERKQQQQASKEEEMEKVTAADCYVNVFVSLLLHLYAYVHV